MRDTVRDAIRHSYQEELDRITALWLEERARADRLAALRRPAPPGLAPNLSALWSLYAASQEQLAAAHGRIAELERAVA